MRIFSLEKNDVLRLNLQQQLAECLKASALECQRYAEGYSLEEAAFAIPILIRHIAINKIRASYGRDNMSEGQAETLVDSIYPDGAQAFGLWCQYFDRQKEKYRSISINS